MSLTGLNKVVRGIRFRLTLVYSTLFGLFICIFAYILTGLLVKSAHDDFDSALLNYAIDISQEIEFSQLTNDLKKKTSELGTKKKFPLIENGTFHHIRDLNGEILRRSQNSNPNLTIPFSKALINSPEYGHRFMDLVVDKETLRAINLKLTSPSGVDYILQVATPSSQIYHQRRRLIMINILVIPSLILITSLASFILAGNALAPIRTLTDITNNIAAKNLSLRVPNIETGDEIEDLSKTINTLLDRLQKSFSAQEHFVANASHQLNTPLAIIKGELDVLESKERSPEDFKKFFKSLREELERLIELVKNMLLISRVESGKESFVFKSLRIDDLLINITSRLNPKARDRRINIKFNIDEDVMESDNLSILGEKQLLDSLFENIIDNAIKYGPEGQPVTITLKNGQDGLMVCLQDEGPGITPQEWERIMSQRFQRGQRAMLPGTGIGLSIAFKIAEHHQAKISYEKLQPQGSLFKITFPK